MLRFLEYLRLLARDIIELIVRQLTVPITAVVAIIAEVTVSFERLLLTLLSD